MPRMTMEDGVAGSRIAIITSGGEPGWDVRRLEEAMRIRGHEPIIVPWYALGVELDHAGVRLCAGGEPFHIDGIVHRLSAATPDGLTVLAAVEDKIPHLNSTGAVLRAANKFATHVRLVEHGIPTPRTALAPNDRELAAFARALGYPVVLKQSGGTRGDAVTLAATRGELLAKAESIRARGMPLLVQEFVAESAGINHQVAVVGGRYVGAVERTGRPGDFRSTGPGDACRTVALTEEEIEIAERTARACGLDLMSIDLLRTKAGPVVLGTHSFPDFGELSELDLCTPIVEAIQRKIVAHHRLRSYHPARQRV